MPNQSSNTTLILRSFGTLRIRLLREPQNDVVHKVKIQLLSDIHIEFEDFCYEETESDVVVLAGDIHVNATCSCRVLGD